ncbi:MAG: hypothetical protein LCH91_23290 [Bacteroidetes bacterium]|nr:hypothetical protein [Bacteroidota bacterium]
MMAIKSLLLSLALTCCLGYTFTFGITNSNSFLHKLPSWSFTPLSIGFGILYLLAFWWGIRGFTANKFASLLSMGFCLVGFGVYAFVITSQLSQGKARKGQYDADFSQLAEAEKAALSEVVFQTGLALNDAVFTEHWHLSDSSNSFRICVQKGHVTGLNLSGFPIKDLQPLSRLPHLTDLYLRHCQLNDLSQLRSERLDRLDISDNQCKDLETLKNCPNLRWLTINNNPLVSKEHVHLFPKMVAFQANHLAKN